MSLGIYNIEPYLGGEISIMALIATYWVLFLAGYALAAVPKWFLFEKAGQPGWAAIVPFYKDYVLFDISWGNGILFLLLLIPLANAVIWIITWVKLAEAFGKGGGWACGLIFLNVIFLYIMAFSNDIVYVGVPGKTPPGGPGGGRPGYRGTYGQPGYQSPYGQAYRAQDTGQNGEKRVKYCPACGSELNAGDKFCPKCGRAQ